MAEAVARARSGGGPTFIETLTYRYADHAVNMGRVLLDRGDEVDKWKKRDPIDLYRARLLDSGVAADVLARIEDEVSAEVADALQFARDSAYPTQAEAFDDVFVDRLPIPAFVQI
jgi:pyruvate dehydrogenase E1 component alpha subunit